MKLNTLRWLWLLVLALPSLLHAQFTFITNNGSITITGCNGNPTTLNIPSTTNGYPVTAIGSNAFTCQPLTSLILPNSITSIGADAFEGCISLTNVILDTNLTTIGADSFGLTRLLAITIPANVTNIGVAAFACCASLTNLAVDPLNSTYSSLSGVLFNKSQTVLLECPGDRTNNYTIPAGVTNIGDFAFYDCYFLTNVTVPFGVTSIGNSAFYYCDGLPEVVVPASVTTINGSAFESCQGLAKIYFQGLPPSADTSIFYGDFLNLTVYYLPGTFGWSAMYEGRNTAPGSAWPFSFSITNGTATITGYTGTGGPLNLPTTINNLAVTCIQAGAFADSRLSAVVLPDSITNIGNQAFMYCGDLTNVKMGLNVNTIGAQAFYSCINLTNLTLPNSLTSIGDYAFYDCYRLTQIATPENVASIGSSSFEVCTGLTNLTISGSGMSIGSYAFNLCTSLMDIFFKGNAPQDDSTEFFADNLATVYYLPGTAGWAQFTTSSDIPTALWNPQIQTTDSRFGAQSNQFGFNITGTTNIPVVVETSTNIGGPWIPLQSLSLTNGMSYFSDSKWTNYSCRFYRISLP